MIRVFSQKINQDSFDIVYDCLINSETDNIIYTHSNEYTNGRKVNAFFVMDFLTLREFINNGQTNYQNDMAQFIEKDKYFEIITHKDKQSISLPKDFLLESYNILGKMWVDD